MNPAQEPYSYRSVSFGLYELIVESLAYYPVRFIYNRLLISDRKGMAFFEKTINF